MTLNFLPFFGLLCTAAVVFGQEEPDLDAYENLSSKLNEVSNKLAECLVESALGENKSSPGQLTYTCMQESGLAKFLAIRYLARTETTRNCSTEKYNKYVKELGQTFESTFGRSDERIFGFKKQQEACDFLTQKAAPIMCKLKELCPDDANNDKLIAHFLSAAQLIHDTKEEKFHCSGFDAEVNPELYDLSWKYYDGFKFTAKSLNCTGVN